MTKESKRIAAYVVLLVIGLVYLSVSGGSQPAATQPASQTIAATQASAPGQGGVSVMERQRAFLALDCQKQSLNPSQTVPTEGQRKQICRCVFTKLNAEREHQFEEDEFTKQCDADLSRWVGGANQELHQSSVATPAQDGAQDAALAALPEAERASYTTQCNDLAKIKANQLGVRVEDFLQLNASYVNQCILNLSRGGTLVATPQHQ